MKKILLGLGTITTITMPIVAVVSCGDFEFKQSDDSIIRWMVNQIKEGKNKIYSITANFNNTFDITVFDGNVLHSAVYTIGYNDGDEKDWMARINKKVGELWQKALGAARKG